MALLEVTDLSVWVQGTARPVVDRLSLRLKHGQTLCVVGESGSGKSMTARAIMGILPAGARLSGRIRFDGKDVTVDKALHRGHRLCGSGMSMVFQEPMASLNPTMRVVDIISESLTVRRGFASRQACEAASDLLEQAGIGKPADVLSQYPWQLSGGLAQRVAIAAALAQESRLLVADEPTTALDVTTQAQILSLLLRLQQARGLAVLFITHDLAIAGLMGGWTAVMHAGAVVETGPTQQVLASPSHAYTASLVFSTPAAALRQGRKRLSVPDAGPEAGAGSGLQEVRPGAPAAGDGPQGGAE
jgi:ABC-type dipeptide/oligopeptide/nickel transport system ATPase component